MACVCLCVSASVSMCLPVCVWMGMRAGVADWGFTKALQQKEKKPEY